MNSTTWRGLLALIIALSATLLPLKLGAAGKRPFLLVVMDPLSRELSCACVEGRGQRNYRKLAARFEAALGERVVIEFSDDLADTLSLVGAGPEVVVIGERAAVEQGARKAALACAPIGTLSDPHGSTTMAGAFLTRGGDPAKELKDLSGRPLFLGMANVEANLAVIRAALRDAGVAPPERPAARGDYSNMALDVLDSRAKPAPVAVIPDFAVSLLTGCGSVRPGELKVIGRTKPVPFITVFLPDAISAVKRGQILRALSAVKKDAALLRDLESRDGFIMEGQDRGAALDWPDWRGANRDGRVPLLPNRLPERPRRVWKKTGMDGALAGISVAEGKVFLAERDLGDEFDVFRCLNAADGETVWTIEFPARGRLDYGQSPRATPVIHGGRAYLLGAFGDLRCVDAANGKLVWERQLIKEFGARLPT